MKKNSEKFTGFPVSPKKGDFWMYPTIMDNYWQNLNGSEQKVLDFILRHTWGFRKTSDQISLSQLEGGVGNLDKGTGLTKPTIIKALRELIKKGFIEKVSKKRINEYRLVVKEINQTSKDSLLIASKNTLYTINTNTINNETINKAYLYESGKRWGEKPFYRPTGEEMRFKKMVGKWFVLLKDNGEWSEFGGSIKNDIEWRHTKTFTKTKC